MANITGRRMTAEIDGDFVVFLIGARFNSFHLVKTVLDLGGRRGMKHMLDYLVAHPESACSAKIPDRAADHRAVLAFLDHLEAFANDTGDPHVAAWRDYWRRVGRRPGPASGTRRTWVGPADMRRSSGTCSRLGRGKAGRLVPSAEAGPRGTASGPPRARVPAAAAS